MTVFVGVVLAYPLILIGVSIWRARSVKSHADFMVAGRSVPVGLLVGTLVCTWIGSGSLFGGAGLAYRSGIAELWFSFGGWLGLLVAYFIAGRVRRIAQYTVPDLLEQRYNGSKYEPGFPPFVERDPPIEFVNFTDEAQEMAATFLAGGFTAGPPTVVDPFTN